jgi:hypothetical protein
MLMNIPRRIIKLPVLINCRYSQGQGRDSTGRDSTGRDSTGRDSQGRDSQGRVSQGRVSQGSQGQSHKTNGLAPLSFDFSFDLSLSLRIFVDWISFPVSYASVWGLGGREGSSN